MMKHLNLAWLALALIAPTAAAQGGTNDINVTFNGTGSSGGHYTVITGGGPNSQIVGEYTFNVSNPYTGTQSFELEVNATPWSDNCSVSVVFDIGYNVVTSAVCSVNSSGAQLDLVSDNNWSSGGFGPVTVQGTFVGSYTVNSSPTEGATPLSGGSASTPISPSAGYAASLTQGPGWYTIATGIPMATAWVYPWVQALGEIKLGAYGSSAIGTLYDFDVVVTPNSCLIIPIMASATSPITQVRCSYAGGIGGAQIDVYSNSSSTVKLVAPPVFGEFNWVNDPVANATVLSAGSYSYTFQTGILYATTASPSFTGNVGIGTTSPAAMLSVGSSSQFQVNSSGAMTATTATLGTPLTVANGGTGAASISGLIKGNGAGPFSAATAGVDFQLPFTLTTAGTTGAATFNGAVLNIPQYTGGAGSYTFSSGLTNSAGTVTNNLSVGVAGGQSVIGGSGVADVLALQGTTANGTSNSAAIKMNVGNNGGTNALTVLNTGSVGIGTTTPGAKLEVDGNIKLTASSGASITFQDGTTQSTAYTGVTCGGDYADSVDVSGERKQYQPGDVLVLTSDGAGDVAKSAEAYSTLVAGIYSTRPGTLGRRQMTDPKTATKEIPMAMVGIVPTKVSAENGPIRRGDLLVTSSMAGYAMKGTDHNRMFGAVVGKAMGSLDSGTGVIEVLVTLQ